MKQLEELLEMWRKDSDIDRTEPGKELTNIPKLHSKYINILSRHRLLAKETEFKLNKIRRLKWEYYTGKLDDDDDINKQKAALTLHNEIVEVCQAIIKELNNRTWELRSFIDWEKFIQGV